MYVRTLLYIQVISVRGLRASETWVIPGRTIFGTVELFFLYHVYGRHSTPDTVFCFFAPTTEDSHYKKRPSLLQKANQSIQTTATNMTDVEQQPKADGAIMQEEEKTWFVPGPYSLWTFWSSFSILSTLASFSIMSCFSFMSVLSCASCMSVLSTVCHLKFSMNASSIPSAVTD